MPIVEMNVVLKASSLNLKEETLNLISNLSWVQKAWIFPVPIVQAQTFFDLTGFSWTTGPRSDPG